MCVLPCNLVAVLCNYMVGTYAGRLQRDVKLKHLPNLPKIDPCSEPWKRVTFVVRNWIFIVPTLHARSYLSCKNQRPDLLTLVTLTCQTLVEYR